MKKRAFTLVELLAIIVILGIVLVIAIPKINNTITINKEESFFVSAKSIIRELDYLTLDNATMSKTALSELDFNKNNTQNYDLNNSYAFIRNGEVFLSIVGINKYDGMRMCSINSSTKEYQASNNECNYSVVTLTVEYDGGESSQTFNETYNFGDIVNLETPTKENYDFTHWKITNGNGIISGNTLTIGTDDITIKASWTGNIELTVNLDGGSISLNREGQYSPNDSVKLFNPTKSGYQFSHWSIESGNSTISGNILTIGTTDTNIKANWIRKTSLTLDLDGGNITVNPTGLYLPNDSITLSNPEKEDYTFSYWSVESGNSTISGNTLTIGTTDTVIKANYIVIKYLLTFNPNGGNVSESTKEIVYLGNYGELPIATKEDYAFAGWYTANNNGTKINSETILTERSNKTVYAHWVLLETEFGYNGTEQIFIVPEEGDYQLEVWGAQGGCSLNNNVKNCNKVGYGGYSIGKAHFTKGTNLYVYVGGKGTDGTLNINVTGGYNGGGIGTWDNADDEAAGGGGGATHIATKNGLLSSLSFEEIDKILIVSGGGGGCSWSYSAGSGGGYYGGRTSTTNQNYVTQNAGFSFGKGQNAQGTGSSDGVGGGGGGLYGGYMNNVAGKSSGSGGSGYIGNQSLTNKSMYCYNCEESTIESTYTINTMGSSPLKDSINCPNGFSSDPISKCAKSGDGYAKITYVGD